LALNHCPAEGAARHSRHFASGKLIGPIGITGNEEEHTKGGKEKGERGHRKLSDGGETPPLRAQSENVTRLDQLRRFKGL